MGLPECGAASVSGAVLLLREHRDCHGLALRSVPRNIPRNTEIVSMGSFSPWPSLPSGSRSPCI